MTEDLSDTVTVADADLLTEIGDHQRPMYLEGKKLARARRLEKRGYLVRGRLGDRYYDLSPERGVSFYQGRQKHERTAGAPFVDSSCVAPPSRG